MLSREQAQERLKEFKNPRFEQEQLQRIVSLQKNLSFIGQILVHGGPAFKQAIQDPERAQKAHRDALAQLGQLQADERQKLFKAWFGKLAPRVEDDWKLFDMLPYQTSYYRRPFRSPTQSLVHARVAWIDRLLDATRGYDQEVTWFAAWAPYLGYGAPDALGYLFAGAIDAGGKTGQEVFDILIASANGSHETGAMGRHVVRGLLCSSRREGWEFIERMLLAAQREEGLRQVILESVDEAHPQAFRRLLRLIVEHNLIRFSAAIRAFDVWFGLALETVSQKTVNELLVQLLDYLDHPEQRERALREGSAQQAYYALWALAFDGVEAALLRARELRRSAEPERRFAATHLLAQMVLKSSFQELIEALEDPDLSVAALAATNLSASGYDPEFVAQSNLFEALERMIQRLPHKVNTFKPLVWDWLELKLERATLANRLVDCLGSRPPESLLPYLPLMDSSGRHNAVRMLAKSELKNAATRAMLLKLTTDTSSSVREGALKALRDLNLTEEEMAQVEELLTRQTADFRRAVMQLLLDQLDRKLLHSISRLLDQKNDLQRLAGLELLRECVRTDRSQPECRRLAAAYRPGAALSVSEQQLLDELLAGPVEQYSQDDSLGLAHPQDRTQASPPPSGGRLAGLFKKFRLGGPAAVEILASLEQLVQEHGVEPVEVTFLDGRKETQLLGNVRHGFPAPDPSLPWEQGLAHLPLRDVWEAWWQNRPAAMRDGDGFELLRASALLGLFRFTWDRMPASHYEISPQDQSFFGVRVGFKLNHQPVIQPVLSWLALSDPAPREVPFLLEALEVTLDRLSIKQLSLVLEQNFGSNPVLSRLIPQERLAYLRLCRWHRSFHPTDWGAAEHARLWKAVRWLDEPQPGLPRFYPELEDALFAFKARAATRADLVDLLFGSRAHNQYYAFRWLRELSRRKPSPHFNDCPALKDVVDACRERIISIEVRRGDLPTAASRPAQALSSVPGMQNLFRLLAALGETPIERGHHFSDSRQSVLSALIRASYPLDDDKPQEFARLASAGRFPERRLVELALFAPQWASFVEAALGWPGLREAAFWVYAHTKDRQWDAQPDIRQLWAAQIGEYTPISADSLMDGAVDVAWFEQVQRLLGAKRWQVVYNAAVLTAGGNGHTRARLFADAMLGKATPDELIKRITQKRHQDAVRALGLVPLPAENRQAEILRRYEVIQEFLRTSKKFGSQRQASEKLAVAIALENLARNTGFSDPQRLEWAMEIEAVADLRDGPIELETDGVSLSFSIDELGEPQLLVARNGKQLKEIPAKIKKEPRVMDLLERKRKLERQASRMRQSLEQAMCRGDIFSAAELGGLFQHPILQAMLEQLIFVGSSGIGYPVDGCQALYLHSGQQLPLAPQDEFRIAHPYDLLEGGEWQHWQHECFIAERIQPFKQVFRELYVLTTAEKSEQNLSRRYAGQQVNPRQALALFGGRGWAVNPEEGVHKTFHQWGLSARVGFLQGAFTPAEVEGLTLEAVLFTRRGEWKPLPLEDVPARMFSEVMRDIDLVVSVAHAGGVDPEASASSIEARATLIQETCALLGVHNVQVRNNHALVSGKVGNYTIHLGSAVVHKQPGGALCIIPVHSQQRGRLFLPFVDNDPKTAELISKVILLAMDYEIKDPTILEQIL